MRGGETPLSHAVVFVQRRAHRAGAQTCLLRLLRQPLMRELDPVLVTGEAGWLTRECEREGIACLIEPFPSSRSILGRIYKNRAFALRVAKRLDGAPHLVHGNDHLEGLLTHGLGKALKAKTALFLRSPTMTRADFDKYRCAEADLIAAVGEMLQGFDPRTLLIHDGLEPQEFLPPKPPPEKFPQRILVLGSAVQWKGWGDAVELAANFPRVKFSFTGVNPGVAERPNLEFLGRVEAFRDLVRGHDLALNPTWHESFGMAALEVLAAGVPLLSTRSGVIEQVIHDERYLAKPRDVGEMRDKLLAISAGWPASALDVAACQARIRERFLVERAAQRLRKAYGGLLHGQHGAKGLADPRLGR